MARDIRLTRIYSRTQEIAEGLGSLHFSRYNSHSPFWAPSVNVYRYEDRYEVCADLAGVDKGSIQVKAEPKTLLIEGTRPSPAPDCDPAADSNCRQTLALEIENGPFQREIRLPVAVDTNQVQARQENGFLWITLPLQRPTPPTP